MASTLWYDILSKDPKGIIHTCPRHSWEDDPNLFLCENCERVLVDHYAGERYQVELHADRLCLRCAAVRYFNLPQSWIGLNAVTQLLLEPEDGPLFDRRSGVLNLAHCRHVLAVGQPLPPGIKLVDIAKFDAAGGHQICGANPLEVIGRLDEPFCPVLDGAWQFAFRIGIYVRQDRKGKAVRSL